MTSKSSNVILQFFPKKLVKNYYSFLIYIFLPFLPVVFSMKKIKKKTKYIIVIGKKVQTFPRQRHNYCIISKEGITVRFFAKKGIVYFDYCLTYNIIFFSWASKMKL
jgi:hypothetical protein